MPTQRVVVSKEYVHRRTDAFKTLLGIIEVEADTLEEAQKKIEAAMADREKPLQTIDPRIRWDEDFCEGDGWDYEDWSFGINYDVDAEDVDLPDETPNLDSIQRRTGAGNADALPAV